MGKQKIKKPALLKFDAGGCFFDPVTGLVVNGQGASLTEAKRLCRWLPRMIKYLDARYGRHATKAAKGEYLP